MVQFDVIFAITAIIVFIVILFYCYKLIEQRNYFVSFIWFSYSIIFAGYIYVFY